jgi:hypothetical protein
VRQPGAVVGEHVEDAEAAVLEPDREPGDGSLLKDQIAAAAL